MNVLSRAKEAASLKIGVIRLNFKDWRNEVKLNHSTSPELDKYNKTMIGAHGTPWVWWGGRRYGVHYSNWKLFSLDTGAFWTRGKPEIADELTTRYGDIIRRRKQFYREKQPTFVPRRFLGIRIADNEIR